MLADSCGERKRRWVKFEIKYKTLFYWHNSMITLINTNNYNYMLKKRGAEKTEDSEEVK